MKQLTNQHDLVNCVIQQNNIILSSISLENGQFELKACKHIPLELIAPSPLCIYKLSALKKNIEHFITTYRIKNPMLALSLTSPALVEQTVLVSKASPNADELYTDKLDYCIWEYRYLYPHENGRHIFYICGIRRELLLQLQLLACSLNHNLVTITSEFVTYLKLYAYICGTTYRQSKLAQDLYKHKNAINKLVDPSVAQRVIKGAHLMNKTWALPTIGLYLTALEN